MTVRYHESREKQMNDKIHGLAHSQNENAANPRSAAWLAEHRRKKAAVLQSAIQLLTCLIQDEKGGGALDNWLEAERNLREIQYT